MVLDPFPLWCLVSSSVNETVGLEDVLLLWRKFLWSLLQRYEKGRKRMQSGGRRGDTRSEKGGRSLSAHLSLLSLPLLPFVFSSGFLLPLPCPQTSTSPSFLSHACLHVVFNGPLTMSRGQRRKRKYFSVGAISHWRGHVPDQGFTSFLLPVPPQFTETDISNRNDHPKLYIDYKCDVCIGRGHRRVVVGSATE